MENSNPIAKSKPFPWECPKCFQRDVAPRNIDFSLQVNHEGRLHAIVVPGLRVPVCAACGERVFTSEADDVIEAAVRQQLHLLTRQQIQESIVKLGMRQNELASRLGVAEETVCRWIDGSMVQTRAMDNLLRAFFALPQLRAALTGPNQAPDFGASVLS